MKQQIRIERLGNGLIQVFDYAGQWRAVYNPDGSYRFGPAPDRYRSAVSEYLKQN